MTVGELRDKIAKMPADTEVYFPGGEHRHDWRKVNWLQWNLSPNMAQPAGLYLLSYKGQGA